MPRKAAQRLQLAHCSEITPPLGLRGVRVDQCEIRDGTAAYYPCFEFDIDRARVIVAVHSSGCDELVYDPATDRFTALGRT